MPKVTLLISAYNEESVIEAKILNSLSLEYPKDILEIIVISDASTDGTDEIAGRYEKQGIRLLRYGGRQGKTACLNNAVQRAQGEILVFSDANSLYDKQAVRNLAARFQDTSIGFVTGFTRYQLRKGDGISEGIGLYSKLEKFLKSMESVFGRCVGADGAIFAIRKELYTFLHPEDINDFVIPLSIIKQGFKGVVAEDAFCSEDAGVGARGEFNRQVRITARTLRALLNNRNFFDPMKYPFFSFALFSHKLAKLLVPFFLFFLIFSAPFMLSSHKIYAMLLLLALAALHIRASREGNSMPVISRFVSFVRIFTSTNLAILLGWLKFLKRETYTTWAPTQR